MSADGMNKNEAAPERPGDRRENGTSPEWSDERTLYETAVKMRERSYAPYSHFRVGAALLAKDGTVFTGCNIENASYGACNCAERTAIFKAVSEGVKQFAVIAIAGGPEGAEELDFCPPCGICRQVMEEFCGPDFRIILGNSAGELKSITLAELLPYGFGPGDLDK